MKGKHGRANISKESKGKEGIMKQKKSPTDFVQVLKFLEALKVQLEDRESAAIRQSLIEYGLLVPIVVASSREKVEEGTIVYGPLRKAQIKDIDQAIKVMRTLTLEGQRGLSVLCSEFNKLGV